jgi:hypothetical protein
MQTSLKAAVLPIDRLRKVLPSSLAIFASLAVLLSAGSASAQDAKLTLSPALIVTGATDRLAIESDGKFDLSKVTAAQITITPDHDVRGVKILDTAPKQVAIALDLSTNAQLGKRTVSIKVGDQAGKAELDIIQGAALVVEVPGAKSANKAVTTTINVGSRAGVDLSKVKAGEVKLTPADFSVVEIVNQTADGLTLGLKVPAAKKNAIGSLKIGGDVNVTAEFSLAGPHAAKACGKLQQCCAGDAAKCTSCVPLDQVCRRSGS